MGQIHKAIARLLHQEIRVNSDNISVFYPPRGRQCENWQKMRQGTSSGRTPPDSFKCIETSHYAHNDTAFYSNMPHARTIQKEFWAINRFWRVIQIFG